jgi:hypothetical protein
MMSPPERNTMNAIDYETGRDPLYRDVPLRHRTTIPVLGFPVHFASNARAVIETAEDAFGGWRVLDQAPALVEETGMDVTIVVQPGDEGEGEHAEIYHRVVGRHRVFFGSRGSIAYADPERKEAIGFVTARLAADRQHFRYMILEAMTLALLTFHDRQPLHAAALVRGDTAVVLAGPSGVGKSTLVYAAARTGIHVLAEDTIHLQASPRLRVWGLPGFVHLPPDSTRRFAELRRTAASLRANGKEKIAVDLRELGALPDLPVVERAAVCILSRGEAGPGLRPLDSEAAGRALTQNPELGFDLFTDTIQGPLTMLLSGGAWGLELTDDPDEALHAVQRLFEEIPSVA